MHQTMIRFHKSPFPANNIPSRNEDILSDIVYSVTPLIDHGSIAAALYSGRTSHVLDAYVVKSCKRCVNTIEGLTCECGAPTCLFSDHSSTIPSTRALNIFYASCIGQWSVMQCCHQRTKRLVNLWLVLDVLHHVGCCASSIYALSSTIPHAKH